MQYIARKTNFCTWKILTFCFKNSKPYIFRNIPKGSSSDISQKCKLLILILTFEIVFLMRNKTGEYVYLDCQHWLFRSYVAVGPPLDRSIGLPPLSWRWTNPIACLSSLTDRLVCRRCTNVGPLDKLSSDQRLMSPMGRRSDRRWTVGDPTATCYMGYIVAFSSMDCSFPMESVYLRYRGTFMDGQPRRIAQYNWSNVCICCHALGWLAIIGPMLG